MKNKTNNEVKSETKSKANNEVVEVLNKIFICIIVIALVLVINTIVLISNNSKLNNVTTSGSNNNNNNDQNGNGQQAGEYDISKFKEIKANELANNTKGKTSVVYIGRATCGWCVEFVPVLKDAISQYGIEVLYIDLAKIIEGNAVKDQASYDIMINLDTVDNLKDYMSKDFSATPMLLIMKDGKILDAQTGYTESIASILENNGFKK